MTGRAAMSHRVILNYGRPLEVLPTNKQVLPNKQSGRPTLTVHSRVFWEGPSCAPAVNTCRENFARDVNAIFRRAGVKLSSSSSSSSSSSDANAKVRHSAVPAAPNHEIASVACFLTPDAINLVLDRSGHSSIARITNCSSSPNHHGAKPSQVESSQAKASQQCRPWLLGSDGQTMGIIESMAAAYGAKQFKITDARAKGLLNRECAPAAYCSLTAPFLFLFNHVLC